MSELEIERKKLNELVEKYGTDNELVLEQSEILDKLILQETIDKQNTKKE